MSTTILPAATAVPPAHDVPVTYERIAASIAAVTVHGAEVRVHWKDPLTGAPLGDSTAMMTPDASLAGRVQQQARHSIVREVAAAVLRVISGVIGSHLGGGTARVLRDVAYATTYDLQVRALAGATFTESSRRIAVVRAFEAVRARFRYDDVGRRFIVR